MDTKSEKKITEPPKSPAMSKFGNFVSGAACGMCALLALDWAVLKNPKKALVYAIAAVLCALCGYIISKSRKAATVTPELEDNEPDHDEPDYGETEYDEAEDEKVEAPLV